MAGTRTRQTLAVVAVAIAWGAVPAVSSATGRSPRSAAEALPLPPERADEAVARWANGDLEVTRVLQAAQAQVDAAARELGRQAPFDWDDSSRRAAANRLAPGETSAALALQQAHAAEPVSLGRALETLARAPRREIEEDAAQIEVVRSAAREACQDDPCRASVDGRAKAARSELLGRLLAGRARWELLRLRVSHVIGERQRLVERIATATSDPFLVVQAKGLLAGSWRAVAELAAEVERETALAARLAGPAI